MLGEVFTGVFENATTADSKWGSLYWFLCIPESPFELKHCDRGIRGHDEVVPECSQSIGDVGTHQRGVAQLAERQSHNLGCAGPNPAPATKPPTFYLAEYRGGRVN